MITEITDRNKGCHCCGKRFYYTEYHGLSTDTKPTTAGNGSVFFEMDTKNVYMFDCANSQWRQI